MLHYRCYLLALSLLVVGTLDLDAQAPQTVVFDGLRHTADRDVRLVVRPDGLNADPRGPEAIFSTDLGQTGGVCVQFGARSIDAELPLPIRFEITGMVTNEDGVSPVRSSVTFDTKDTLYQGLLSVHSDPTDTLIWDGVIHGYRAGEVVFEYSGRFDELRLFRLPKWLESRERQECRPFGRVDIATPIVGVDGGELFFGFDELDAENPETITVRLPDGTEHEVDLLRVVSKDQNAQLPVEHNKVTYEYPSDTLVLERLMVYLDGLPHQFSGTDQAIVATRDSLAASHVLLPVGDSVSYAFTACTSTIASVDFELAEQLDRPAVLRFEPQLSSGATLPSFGSTLTVRQDSFTSQPDFGGRQYRYVIRLDGDSVAGSAYTDQPIDLPGRPEWKYFMIKIDPERPGLVECQILWVDRQIRLPDGTTAVGDQVDAVVDLTPQEIAGAGHLVGMKVAASSLPWMRINSSSARYYAPPTGKICVAPPDDMVAWWSFDDPGLAGGASAKDLTSDPGIYHPPTFDNTMQLSNGAGVVPGYVGSALAPGTGSGPVPIVWNHAEINPANTFSIVAWYKPVKPVWGFRSLYQKANASGGFYFMRYYNDVRFYVRKPGSSVLIGGGKTLAWGASWRHVAVTVNSSKTCTIYFDGIPVRTMNLAILFGYLSSPAHGVIGSPPINLPGAIDELMLFKRALSPAEIFAIYNAGSAGVCKDGSHLQPDCFDDFAPGTEPIVWWPLDDEEPHDQNIAGHVITTPDIAGPENTFLRRINTEPDATGIDGGLRFKGLQGSYAISAPYQVFGPPAFSLGDKSFSIDLLVNPATPNPLLADGLLIQKLVNTSLPGFRLTLDDGRPVLTLHGSNYFNYRSDRSEKPLNMNQWNRVTFVVDRDGPESVTCYVNNVMVPTKTEIQSGYAVSSLDNAGDILLGQHFDGSLDDVKIYRGAFTQAEIDGIYGDGPCPPAPFTGSITGTVLIDADCDGTGETPVEGWKVELDNGMITYTAADGTYTFDGVEPGDYDVTLTIAQDYVAGSPAGGIETVTGVMFGQEATADFLVCELPCVTFKRTADEGCCRMNVNLSNIPATQSGGVKKVIISTPVKKFDGLIEEVELFGSCPGSVSMTGGNVSGADEATIEFNTPCAGDVDFEVEAISTTSLDTVTLKFEVVLADGRICTFRRKIECAAAPSLAGPQLSVAPADVDSGQTGRRFSIENRLSPPSPIVALSWAFDPPLPEGVLALEGLRVDGQYYTLDAGFFDPASGSLGPFACASDGTWPNVWPANLFPENIFPPAAEDQVGFALRFDSNAAGRRDYAVRIDAEHCDGRVSSMEYRWIPAAVDVVTGSIHVSDEPQGGALAAAHLKLDLDLDDTVDVGWVQFSSESSDVRVVGYGVGTMDTVYPNGVKSDQKETGAAGEPVPGVVIVLDQIPGGIIGHRFDVPKIDRVSRRGLAASMRYRVFAESDRFVEDPVDVPITVTIYDADANPIATSRFNATFRTIAASSVSEQAVAGESDDLHATLIPNPTRDHVVVDIVSRRTGHIIVEIHDETGRTVAVEDLGYSVPGTRNVAFELGDLASGVYHVRIVQGDETIVRTLRIVR